MSVCDCMMSLVRSPFSSSSHYVPFFQSPFSTSPSQLQEVSLDLSSSMQQRASSPGKMTPPMRGRTMKEYEEDMSKLKKENFRLKLRIFSLDDQMEKLVKDGGTVDVLKRNVELQVELEALRKEYEDTQMLLVKAHQLVEMTDKECKEALTEKDNEISALTSRVDELKRELEVLRSSISRPSNETSPRVFKFGAQQSPNVTEKRISDLEDKTRRLTDSVRSQETELERRNEELSELQNVLEERTREITRLGAVLEERDAALEELTAKVKAYEHEIRWMREKSRSPCGSPRRHSCKVIVEQALELEQKYKNLDGEHQKALMAIQGLLKRSKDQARELEECRSDIGKKERRVRELASEIGRLCAKMDRCQTRGVELDDMVSNDEFDIVEELERQVKGIALALIERDDKLSDYEKNLMDRDRHIEELANEINRGDDWKRRAAELEARLHNTPERDVDSFIVTNLRAEVLRARKELEKAEIWQQETGDKCSILMRRLEELALFLKSLLMDGRLLCGLSEKQRMLLQKIIDESMEMSRNLSLSLFGSADTSLANGSLSFMGDTHQQSFLEFWSQDEEENDLIARLGAEVEKLKLETYSPATSKEQVPRLSPVKNTKDLVQSTRFSGNLLDGGEQAQSIRERTCSPCESDVWSEPDRNVSLARIGLPVSDVITSRSCASSVSEDSALDLTGKDKNIQVERVKIHILEKANEDLKCQLVALHEWFSKLEPSSEKASGSLNIETSHHESGVQGLVTVSSIELLEQVKVHRDKLESLLRQNEQTQKKLEEDFGHSGIGNDLLQKLEVTQSLKEQLEVLKTQEVNLRNQVNDLNKHVEVKEQEVCELTAKVEQQQEDLKKSEELRLKIEEQLCLLESEICEYKDDKVRLEQCVASLELKCSESQNFNDRLEKNILLLDDNLREANELRSQLQSEILILDEKYKRSEEKRLELQKEIELLQSKCTELELEKCSLQDQVLDLQKKLSYAEQCSYNAASQVATLQEENRRISEDLENRHRELDKKLREAEKFGSHITSQMIEQTEKHIKEVESRLLQKEREVEKKNEELTIQVSQLQMENARLENEKLHVERELNRVEMLTEKTRSPRRRVPSGGSQASSLDYEWENPENTSASSMEVVNHNARSSKVACISNLWVKLTENEAGTVATVGMNRAVSRGTNSPDLGIESDNGRFSSVETMHPDYQVSCKSCVNLHKENVYLKHKQLKTESLLNDVYAQLSSANQMKREMRKSVFKELCKTKSVLKATRSNLETAMPRRLSD